MHRTHDAGAPARAARILRDEGITNWSLDLIYALPADVPRDWRADVDRALALEPSHVSAYGLTVEQGTPLARWQARGRTGAVDDEQFAREFTDLHGWLAAAGYEHYEVSNYALPGRQAVHNSAYWRQIPYLGLGPSAHGFDGAVRRWNVREFAAWSMQLSAGRDPEGGREELAPEQRALETMYLGLRTRVGIAAQPSDGPMIAEWTAAGWAREGGGRIVLTPDGWLRLDALVAALTEHRSHY
jgi:oxygen-independent coproporphyrinogen-3 oxidase